MALIYQRLPASQLVKAWGLENKFTFWWSLLCYITEFSQPRFWGEYLTIKTLLPWCQSPDNFLLLRHWHVFCWHFSVAPSFLWTWDKSNSFRNCEEGDFATPSTNGRPPWNHHLLNEYVCFLFDRESIEQILAIMSVRSKTAKKKVNLPKRWVTHVFMSAAVMQQKKRDTHDKPAFENMTPWRKACFNSNLWNILIPWTPQAAKDWNLPYLRANAKKRFNFLSRMATSRLDDF